MHWQLFIVVVAWQIAAHFTNASTQAPEGVGLGQPYRIAFITSAKRDALSSAIEDYNSFVDNAAKLTPGSLIADLDTSWKAIASTEFVSARANTDTELLPTLDGKIPVYLVDGTTKIANHYDDLWNSSLLAPLNRDQNGSALPDNGFMWTGGNRGLINDWALGSATREPNLGIIGQTGLFWFDGLTFPASQHHHLYGISGVMFAVPEPTSSLIVLVGIALLPVQRRSR
jgi:hypothetical protein